jgi:endoglucanase
MHKRKRHMAEDEFKSYNSANIREEFFIMEKVSLEFLKRLIDTISPSGYEEEAARVWMNEAESFSDDVTMDLHGNVIAVVNKGGSPRIMLAGHMDEIGFQVNYIDENGFIYFTQVGGWDPQILQGQRVWIRTKNGHVLGVMGKKPIHLLKTDERTKVTEIDQCWIDIGVKNMKAAAKLVDIGDPVVLAYGLELLRGDLYVSRGFDDKAGAFVALEAARMLAKLKPKAEVHAVATVQEEIGLRGATTSAYGIDPKVGFAIDVEFATDFPSMDEPRKKIGEVKMGGGPVVVRGANISPKVYDLLVAIAKKRKIPYQVIGEARGTGTDANAIQLNRAGVATGLIGVPNRYMHSPCEVVSLSDLENSHKLLAYAIAEINDKMDFRPFVL